MVLHQVLVSGPITALAAASPQRKVTIFGGHTSGLCGGRKEGPQGFKAGVLKDLIGEGQFRNPTLRAAKGG